MITLTYAEIEKLSKNLICNNEKIDNLFQETKNELILDIAHSIPTECLIYQDLELHLAVMIDRNNNSVNFWLSYLEGGFEEYDFAIKIHNEYELDLAINQLNYFISIYNEQNDFGALYNIEHMPLMFNRYPQLDKEYLYEHLEEIIKIKEQKNNKYIISIDYENHFLPLFDKFMEDYTPTYEQDNFLEHLRKSDLGEIMPPTDFEDEYVNRILEALHRKKNISKEQCYDICLI